MHQTPKIKKIIGELHKASRTHKGQAERLEGILKVMQNVDKKKRGSRKGKQFVENTKKARKARKMASKRAARSMK